MKNLKIPATVLGALSHDDSDATLEALNAVLLYLGQGIVTRSFRNFDSEFLFKKAMEILGPYMEREREKARRREDRKAHPEKYPPKKRKPRLRSTAELKDIATNERQAREADYFFIDENGQYVFLVRSGHGQIVVDEKGRKLLRTTHNTDVLRAYRKHLPNKTIPQNVGLGRNAIHLRNE